MAPMDMTQLFSPPAMEPPVSFHADAVRDEQAKALHAVQALAAEEVLVSAVRGQYDEGILEGQHVPAYRSEPKIDPHSNTETFVAFKFFIGNRRSAGAPCSLRPRQRPRI